MQSAGSARHAVVLVADDDHDIREMLRTMLEIEGLQVLEAATGPEAWTSVQSHRPSLVIGDVHMPGYGVINLARLVRTHGLVRTKLLAFTAGLATEAECLEAGCDGYLLKSEELARLQHTVRRMLEAVPR